MDELVKIINALKQEPGLNAKMEIIKLNKENPLLECILNFAFNPTILTGISRKKMAKKVDKSFDIVSKTLLDLMKYLMDHGSGRDIDIAWCQQFILKSPENQRELIEEIVTKTLNIGMGTTLINKAYGKILIPKFEVMLAYKYADNIKRVNGRFIVTRKLDGIRCLLFKDQGRIRFFTRQGLPIYGLEEIEKEASSLSDGMVYDGELLLANKGSDTSADHYRATVKTVRKDGPKFGVEFHVFDRLPIVDFNQGICNVKCVDRKAALANEIKSEFSFIKNVPALYEGLDKNMIPALLESMIAEGEEGIMINLSDAPYECKRSFGILKVKQFHDADVKVVALHEGEGEIKGKLGAISIEFLFNGESYICRCGSGFTKEQREDFWNNPEMLSGKIVKIGYFEITKNQEGGVGLRFPTFVEIREDKNEISMN